MIGEQVNTNKRKSAHRVGIVFLVRQGKTISMSQINTFPLKSIVGDWLSSAFNFFLSFNFDIFEKYLNESY